MELLPEKPNAAARAYLVTGAVWAVLGSTAGLLGALELVAPDRVGHVPWLGFARTRQVHVNVVLFGFVFSLLMAGMAHVVPRLCRVQKLWSERLGVVAALLWNLVFIGAAATLPFGMTQGREYAELIFPLDVLFLLSMGLFTVTIFMTLATRREKLLYVSLWYIVGGLLWTLSVYFLGNVMWRPPEGAIVGVMDSVWNWFHGRNVVGLILTPAATAMAYWVIPRAVKAPIWSHSLALIGFWLLLILQPLAGTSHLLQAPVPTGLKVLSIVASVGLLVPVTAVLLNLWLPMRGRWGRIHENIGAKFVFAGTVWYALTCFQGVLQSLPGVQRLTHFTHWVVAHAHIAVLGFAGFIAIGTAYAILPAVANRPLWSRRMADLHFWLITVGLTMMFLVLTVGGLVQGAGWLNGEAFYRTVPQMHVYHVLRAVAGVVVVASIYLLAVNVLMTLLRREAPRGVLRPAVPDPAPRAPEAEAQP